MAKYFIVRKDTNWRVLTQDKIPMILDTEDNAILEKEMAFYEDFLRLPNRALEAIEVEDYYRLFEVEPQKILREMRNEILGELPQHAADD